MNFPELKTARLLSDTEMLNFRGGACGSGCKSGCSSSCKGGCSQSKKNNVELEISPRETLTKEYVRQEFFI